MTIELQMLFWSSATLLGLLFIQGALVPINQGFGWGLGSRDDPRPQTALQGRMRRLVNNHIEGLTVFAAIVIVAHLAGVFTSLSQTGAVVFVLARLGFAGLYMAGIPVLRSLVWGISVAGILMVAADLMPALW